MPQSHGGPEELRKQVNSLHAKMQMMISAAKGEPQSRYETGKGISISLQNELLGGVNSLNKALKRKFEVEKTKVQHQFESDMRELQTKFER